MVTRIACLFFFVAFAQIGFGQTIDVSGAKPGTLPKYRPILIGTGPTALINRIDTQDLIKKGQKEGAVMFVCAVRRNGIIESSGTYHAAGDVKVLEAELQQKLLGSAQPKMIPGIYDHNAVDALYFGTMTFAVVNGKPRLRIFSNQQIEEVNKESDFIGPQPIFHGVSKFTGFHYPTPPGSGGLLVDGFVAVRVKVDENGNMQSLNVVDEQPPLLGFAEAAQADLTGTKFIPAFRSGKPVACDVTLPIYYRAPGF